MLITRPNQNCTHQSSLHPSFLISFSPPCLFLCSSFSPALFPFLFMLPSSSFAPRPPSFNPLVSALSPTSFPPSLFLSHVFLPFHVFSPSSFTYSLLLHSLLPPSLLSFPQSSVILFLHVSDLPLLPSSSLSRSFLPPVGRS